MPRLPRISSRTRHELLLLTTAVMEISWLGLLLRGAMEFNHTRWLPLFAAWIPLPYLGIMLVAYAFYRWISRRGISRAALRRAVGAFIVAGILIMLRVTVYAGYAPLDVSWLLAPFSAFADLETLLPDELVIAIATLILFARGFSLAHAEIDSQSVGFRFRLGVLLLGLALAAAMPDLDTVPVVITFFFVGLCAIAIARTAEAGLESGGTSRFGPAWLAGVMGSAAIILLLSTGLTALMTGENILRFLGLLQPLLFVVGVLAGAVVYLLSLLSVLLMPLIQALIDMFEGLRDAFGDLFPASSGAPAPAEAPELGATTLQILSSAKGILTVVALVLVVGVILWAMNAIIGRRQESDEERETVFSTGLVAQALRDLFKSGQNRLGALLGQARQFGLSGLFAAFTIRRIYAQMSFLAARRGHPRGKSDTPLEYRPALRQAFPGCEPEIERITTAYLGVRYGELPETPEDLNAVRTAWEQLRGTGIGQQAAGN